MHDSTPNTTLCMPFDGYSPSELHCRLFLGYIDQSSMILLHQMQGLHPWVCVLCFEAPPRVLYAKLQGLWLRIWHTKFRRLCHWYGTLHYGGLWPHLLCIEFWTLHNKLGISIYGGNNHKLTYWIVELHKWLYPKEANSLRNRAHLANKQRSLTDYLRESHFLSSHRRLLSFTSSWSSSSSTHLTPQEASDLLCCLILTASTHTQD
jgi:hypothetical protein